MDRGSVKNFDEFLKAAGFPEAMITTIKNREYKLRYKLVGNTIEHTVWVTNENKEKSYVFEIGKEQEIVGVDNEKTLSVMTWDGNKFVDTHKALDGSYEFVMTR